MTEHAEAYEKLDRAIRDFHAEVNEGLMPLEWVLVSGLVSLADDDAGDEACIVASAPHAQPWWRTDGLLAVAHNTASASPPNGLNPALD